VDKHPEIVKEARERLGYWATQARAQEAKGRVPDWPVVVYGEEECKGSIPDWLKRRVERARTSGEDMTAKEGEGRQKRAKQTKSKSKS